MIPRMYRAGYSAGARLAGLPEALEQNRQSERAARASVWQRQLGTLSYIRGFKDGWHRRSALWPPTAEDERP